MAIFTPRSSFPAQLSLPRSYFLGHHASGLSVMKAMLIQIQLVLECRDYRIPLTSRNELFEQALSGKKRAIVYTKKDLGTKELHVDNIREKVICRWHWPEATFFTDHHSKNDMKRLLDFVKADAIRQQLVLPSRILVVGMPNVGKSSLLNSLRKLGVNKLKAAATGAQPGITRKVSSAVRIIDRDAQRGFEGVYLVDTPGVFIPYVSDSESMLKLALVGCVKDTIISPITLCDYLLFQINLQPGGKTLYQEYSLPTNDVVEFLEAVCRRTGKLKKGNVPDLDAAALWIIQRWRQGHLGRFIMDSVEESGLEKTRNEQMATSLNQAKKQARSARKEKSKLGSSPAAS